jgi:hypothetical protein
MDFNTQQTDYVSLRYLSISPPFVLQNLLPAPITLLFRDITDRPGIFDLDMTHNSQQQVSFLHSLENFRFSLLVPGYDCSESVWLKSPDDKDVLIAEEIREKKTTNQFRFLYEKNQLVCLRSLYQNSFKVCVHIAFVHGQYQITFYVKYWLLNNTQMPLDILCAPEDKISLPFERPDFDFDSVGVNDDKNKGV